MSHFTLLVRISAETLRRHEGDVNAAVKLLLAPYQENNMGDCPERFLEFNDMEEEYRAEYETGSTRMVRCEDGSLVYPWDERFRVPGKIGTGSGTHKVPDHLKVEEVPHSEQFATFDEYAEDWHGSSRDTKTGRFGYWENPNAKWDWYTVGGRWSGLLPLQGGGKADVATVAELDVPQLAATTIASATRFWGNWETLKSGGKFSDTWGEHDTRSRALSLGLVKVIRSKEDEVAVKGWDVRPAGWEKLSDDDDRRSWKDAFSPISRAEFMETLLQDFNPITTYAVLDDEGWHSPGKMGWWGCSSESPNERIDYKNSFFGRFIECASPDTTLAIVDCHI